MYEWNRDSGCNNNTFRVSLTISFPKDWEDNEILISFPGGYHAYLNSHWDLFTIVFNTVNYTTILMLAGRFLESDIGRQIQISQPFIE